MAPSLFLMTQSAGREVERPLAPLFANPADRGQCHLLIESMIAGHARGARRHRQARRAGILSYFAAS
jgi:hypothetical protein